MQMPEDHPAARAGRYAGWTVPLNYQPVHDLFMALEIGPYARASTSTIVDVIKQYWYWLVLLLAATLLSISLNILVKRQVIRRTAELSRTNRALQDEVAERKRAEEVSQALLRENRFVIQKYLEVQESERRHLARELHDELGQCITAIQADTQIILDHAADRDGRLVASATAIQDVSSRLYEVVHSMMSRLRPSMLDDLGLVETLKEEVDAWQSRQPRTTCSLSVKGELGELGEPINIALYRIVQECLTNIAKHASACTVDIRLENIGPGGTAHPPVGPDRRRVRLTNSSTTTSNRGWI